MKEQLQRLRKKMVEDERGSINMQAVFTTAFLAMFALSFVFYFATEMIGLSADLVAEEGVHPILVFLAEASEWIVPGALIAAVVIGALGLLSSGRARGRRV